MRYPNWFKNWVSNLPFVRFEILRKASIDAFEKAREDVAASFQGDVEKRADELATKKLTALLTVVDPSLVVTFDKNRRIVYIGGEPADVARLSNLKAEAEFITQSELWKLLNETPKRLAEKAMFLDDGKLETQLLKGRAMLYLLSTQNNIVETFLSYDK